MTRNVKPLIHLEQLEPRILLSGDGLLNITPNLYQDTVLDNPSKVVQEAELLDTNEQVEEQISLELVSYDTPHTDTYQPILTLFVDDDNANDGSADTDLNVDNIGPAQVNNDVVLLLDDSDGVIENKINTSEDGSMPTYINDVDLSIEYATSIEIRGPPTNETITLSVMHLVEPAVENINGQIVYLDLDGEDNVTYDGPVTVEGVYVPIFAAPGGLAGQEHAIITKVLESLEHHFAGSGVIFTTEKPEMGMSYSTIYIGGDDSAFTAYGSFLGLAEQIDVGNQDLSDEAFVFSDNLNGSNDNLQVFADNIANIIAHETGHLLGYAHSSLPNLTVQSLVLSEVALPEITVSGNGEPISDGDSPPSLIRGTIFDAVVQGGSPSSRTFTVRNDGDTILTLGMVAVPTGFTVTDGLPASLAAGASDAFTVRLDTAEAGDKSGYVSFTNNDSDENPFNFRIFGAVQIPTPAIEVLWNGYSMPNTYPPSSGYGTVFGDAVQGKSPVTHTWTVRNDGTATLTLGPITVPTGFTLMESPSASLAPGASDTFTVQLDTVTLGTKSGYVSITNNDSDDNPFNLRITGVVIPDWGPEITVLRHGVSIRDGDATPDYADGTRMGGRILGGSSGSNAFTVRNDGTSTLTLGPITIPSGFVLVEGLSSSLEPGESDTFSIGLDTATLGVKIGDISIANNDSDEDPFEFRVTGTVLLPPEITVLCEGVVITDGDTVPSTLDGTDFGSVDTGALPVVRTFVVRNDGGVDLWTDTVYIPSGFQTVSGMLRGSIAPGESKTFSVKLRTDVPGIKSGEISFANGDTDENPFNFWITGEVVEAVIPAPAEQFTGGSDSFDLDSKAIMFTPDAAGYTIAARWIGALPTDPAGGTTLMLDDDDAAAVSLVDGKTARLYGQSYGNFYVGSNGYITFTQSDTDYSETLADHFDTARISVLFDDLNPSVSGQVSWLQLSDRAVVTWEAVAEIGTGSPNTIQVEMYFDGRIQLAWLGVASQDGIVGLSNGLGLPSGFVETDFFITRPEITVQGGGMTIVDGDTTPSTDNLTDFGTAVGPGSPVSHTFLVRNDGTDTLTLGTVTVPTGFTLTDSPRTSLGPYGGRTTFTVRLDASVPGVKSGDISFSTNDTDENPFNFRITGTVIAAPETILIYNGRYIQDGDITPDTDDGTSFGHVALGAVATHTFTVRNDGNATLTPGAVTVPTGYFLTEALASSIALGASDTFTIQVDTTTGGTKIGTVSFTTNDPDRNPYDFLVDATVIGPPEITVSWDGFLIADGDTTPSTTDGTDFGSVVEDAPAVVRVFTVRNEGGSPLTLGDVTVPSGYSLTDGLLASLPPGMSDTFTVELNTRNPGTKSGAILFSTGDWDENPFNFAITGTVMIPPDITVRGNGLTIVDGDTTLNSVVGTDFGIVTQGGSGRERPFEVRNNGGSTLTLGAVTVPAGYTVTEGLSASLAPGDSDTFTVRLDTETEGTKTGDISFSTNDPDENPFNFLITGQVILEGPEIAVIGNGLSIVDGDTTPSIADWTDFGSVNVTNGSMTRTFTIENVGSEYLNLTGSPSRVIITGSTEFTVTQQPASSVASGGTTTFEVTFDPSSYGTKTATVSIASNDNNENPYDFVIQGTGVLFGSQQVISTQADAAYAVYASDLDGDGDNDILSASAYDDKIAWYENLGGGVFGSQQVISTQGDGARSVYASDLDGDGDNDVLAAYVLDDKIAWFENLGGGAFSSQQVISTQADGAASVYASDLDGDGDNDVLSASVYDDKIAWYENLGGGAFSTQHVLSTQVDYASSVYASDLDGDGDNDVLATARQDDSVFWFENLGGGVFGSRQAISTQADGAMSVYASDLDGDGDNDVLSASQEDDKIAWYENLGSGTFGSQQVISTQADGTYSVYASDLDGDGDNDVLSASYFDDKIAWYENLGGGVFGSQQVISTQADGAFLVYASDLDGDGDNDVLSASVDDDKIAWYENLRLLAPSPQILLSDDFTDGNYDGWSLVDQGTKGGPMAWSAASGVMVQSSNVHTPTFDGVARLGTYAYWQAGTGWTDYTASVTIKSNDNDIIGIMFRYQDENNYYRFTWDKERSTRNLVKCENGQFTILAQDSVPYVTGQSYQVKISAEGSSLQVSIDGSPVFSVNDNTFSSGTIALYSWGNTGSYFDDILVDGSSGGVNQAPVISSVTATPPTISDAVTSTSQLQVNAYDPDNGPNALTYSWTVLSGQGSLDDLNIANPTYTPPDVSATQTFTLTVKVSDGADITTQTVDITVTDASTPQILLSEDFTDGNYDGWSLVDQGTKGGPMAWSAASGVMVQSSNVHTPTFDGVARLGTYAYWQAGFAWTDYTASVTMKSNDNDIIGIMFRYQDENNYYRFTWDQERGTRNLVKCESGQFTILAQDSVPYVTGQSYQVKISAQGSTLQVSIDGSPVLSATDSTFSSGTIALYSWGNTGSYFDDILVEGLP